MIFGLLKEKDALEYTYGKLNTLQDLEDHKSLFEYKINRSELRIYVIDDEGFDIEPLYSLGYTNISRSTQFQDVHAYNDADIILCDIEGVGSNIDPIKQGLSVAAQLKSVFPTTSVFIYSAKNVQSYGDIPPNIDGIIRKQDSMGDIASVLDENYSQKKDVVYVWKNLRQEMIENNVSLKTISYMEHFYCKSLLDGKNLFSSASTKIPFNTEKIEKFIGRLADLITVGLALKGVQ